MRQNEIMKAQSFRIILPFILMACGLSSCDSVESRSNRFHKDDNSDERPLVDDQYRLSSDRKALDEMRKDIPPDVKLNNDEIAFLMKLLNDSPDRDPAKIRSDFDRAIHKKRDLLSKNLTKERDEFTKQERRNREDFLKAQSEERKDFLREKHSKEDRDRFFSSQDEKRRDYFANQREKRNDFESDVTERRRNFEDYAREKTNEFNGEHRAYTKRYEEMKKAKELAKKEGRPWSPEGSNQNGGTAGTGSTAASEAASAAVKSKSAATGLMKEFDEIPDRPSDPLQSGQ